MAGTKVLGQYLSLTKVNLYLNQACLLSHCICDNRPMECQISFSGPLKVQALRERGRHGKSRGSCYHVNC